MSNPYQGVGSTATTISSIQGEDKKEHLHAAPNKNDKKSSSQDIHKLSVRAVLRRLLPFIKTQFGRLILAFCCQLITVILQLSVPVVIGQAIDLMIAQGQVIFEGLHVLLIRLGLLCVSAAFTQWLAAVLLNHASYNTIRDLRLAAYQKLHSVFLSVLDSTSRGDMLSRVINDIDQIGDGILQGLTQLFSGCVMIVATLAFMFYLSVPVAVIVIAFTPLSIFAAWAIARFSSKSFAKQQYMQGKLESYAEEAISNQTLLASFDRLRQSLAAFDVLNTQLKETGERAQFISSLVNPSTRLVNGILLSVVAVVGLVSVITGFPSVLTVGQVQSFLAYANEYMVPFNQISSVVSQIQTAFASARRVFALLDLPDAKQTRCLPLDCSHLKGRLSFRNVSFSYVVGTPVLHDISFQIEPGRCYALVGPTGSGKTTLINLILRFYEPDTGAIFLDEQNIAEISRTSLRSAFGMVLQESWLFEGTIKENIAYGKPDASEDEILLAAKNSHAEHFIRQLPLGFDTYISESGDTLSQGQKQLICIARVMLVDPTILLLDEATSSIDTLTERKVQDAFDYMMKNRTSLVVAHRLSTVQEADCILVMDKGRIVQKGTHAELLAHKGLYQEIYRSQFAGILDKN